jgi:hypothetical protein
MPGHQNLRQSDENESINNELGNDRSQMNLPRQIKQLLVQSFFPLILFSSTTSLTRMTGISLHTAMASEFSAAWQFSQREQFFFITDQTLHTSFFRSLPAQF